MSILDNVRSGVKNFLFPGMDGQIADQRILDMQLRRDYRRGRHRQQIKPRPGKTDDNVYINFSGLVIDRSISMLFGEEPEFDLPGEGDDTPEDEYIAATWRANKKEILLHRMAMYASETGTGYVKIVPNGAMDGDGLVPRLILIDPKWVEMTTNPEDFEQVIRYTIRFNTVDAAGKEAARKQVHAYQDDTANWLIEDYQMSAATGGEWQLMQSEVWPFDWSQILHFQNLPSADDVYGVPDLTDDLLKLQDKLNFVAGNINKIIRLHAHPKSYVYGLGTDNREVISTDPGEIITANNPEAFWKNVEMQSDLSSSANFFLTLRQAFFDVARTVDIDSIADKLGALTNFGLKVLYQDALNKIKTKQRLYGDALLELNRRLLVMAGLNPDPGDIIWKSAIPENGKEESEEYQMDIDMGILSKQSAATMKGYDWEQEQERMSEQETQNTNIGDLIMRNFERGTTDEMQRVQGRNDRMAAEQVQR